MIEEMRVEDFLLRYEHEACALYEMGFSDDKNPSKAFLNLMKGDNLILWMARDETNGPLQGFLLCQWVMDQVEILTIVVRSEAQGQGIGRALVQTLQTRIVNAPQDTQIFLEVASDNDAAIGLYNSTDFEKKGVRKGYYRRQSGERVDAVIMAYPGNGHKNPC